MTGLCAVIGAAAALGLGCATAAPAPAPERTCARGFDASFVQLGRRELGYDRAAWRRALSLLRAAGVELLVVQFTGDENGAYDLRPLLAAAGAMKMKVFLGLDRDPSWPHPSAVSHLAPPLDKPRRARALARLCASAEACSGWYLPQEIDDVSWAGREETLRAHLMASAAALHRLSPGKPIAIAPFFTGALAPDAHARFWDAILAEKSVDVVMLQDGVGTGRATAEMAAGYLAALEPVTSAHGVELWSVAELFRQVHGAPVDEHPFAAVPIHPATLRASLAAERAVARRVVAFAVLDYMDPARGGAARTLYQEYTRCP